jgi:hypothetical protein
MGEDRGTGVPGGVIGKDVGAVGIFVGYLPRCFKGARGFPEEVCAVGLSPDDLLQRFGGDQLLNLGFAAGSAAHDAALPDGVTSTVGEALIWSTRESASLAHCSGVRMTELTCMPRRAWDRSAAS